MPVLTQMIITLILAYLIERSREYYYTQKARKLARLLDKRWNELFKDIEMEIISFKKFETKTKAPLLKKRGRPAVKKNKK